jgi:cobalt/nickel transport system ATP-binding protein
VSRIDAALRDLRSLEALASRDTAGARLDARAKLVTTLAFIVAVVSFERYTVSALLPLAAYPLLLAALGEVPAAPVLRKLLLAAPFAVMVGLFNPLLDRAPMPAFGDTTIAAGWVSFASILLRFALTAGAALVLVACTGMHTLCAALGRLGVPRVFTAQLLFLFRYAFVLGEEAARMTTARAARRRPSGRARQLRTLGRAPPAARLRTGAARAPGDDRARLRRRTAQPARTALDRARHALRAGLVCVLRAGARGRPAAVARRRAAWRCRVSHHLVETRDLAYAYPDGTPALRGVTCRFHHGEAIGVVGANGAGKSTLLLHLNGLLLPQAGEVRIGDLPVTAATRAQIHRTVGFVFQDADDQLFMPTVEEDVAFGPLNMGLPADEVRARVQAALQTVGAAHLAARAPYRLSGGEKRLVAIAGVLAMSPDVLVLDEPSAGLDPAARRRLIVLLRSFTHTRVIATHDLDLVLDVCTRVLVLHEGRVQADGAPCEIFGDLELLQRCHLELPPSRQGRSS